MNSFLWGPGFQGLSEDFGRPRVRQWTGLAYEDGPAAHAPAAVAVRRRLPVPDGTRPGEAAEEAVRECGRLAGTDGVVLTAAAVDTAHWELLHFSLWAHDAPEADGEVFRVLHVSQPGRERLRRGRRW